LKIPKGKGGVIRSRKYKTKNQKEQKKKGEKKKKRTKSEKTQVKPNLFHRVIGPFTLSHENQYVCSRD
jgi:hypothetical protein